MIQRRAVQVDMLAQSSRIARRFADDDVGFELLRRSEQPNAIVHETICEQVHG